MEERVNRRPLAVIVNLFLLVAPAALEGSEIAAGSSVGQGRAAAHAGSEETVPAPPGLGRSVPDVVFAPGSSLPEQRPHEGAFGAIEPAQRHSLLQPGCTICLEGSTNVQWIGSVGSFHADYVTNYKSGTTGSLDLRVALSSSLPVFGQTINYYSLSDVKSLNPLLAGYQYSNVNSGNVNFFPASIPAGQYWMFLYLREFQGGSTWYYTDFTLMNTKASCNGSSCTTAAACTEDSYTMCLVNGRYRITSTWQNQYAGGTVSTLSKTKLTDTTGAFWIANSSTYEYMIRFNTATDNGRAWVAIPTFTDVEFFINVTDTVNGQSKQYHSAPGNRTLLYDPYYFVYP